MAHAVRHGQQETDHIATPTRAWWHHDKTHAHKQIADTAARMQTKPLHGNACKGCANTLATAAWTMTKTTGAHDVPGLCGALRQSGAIPARPSSHSLQLVSPTTLEGIETLVNCECIIVVIRVSPLQATHLNVMHASSSHTKLYLALALASSRPQCAQCAQCTRTQPSADNNANADADVHP